MSGEKSNAELVDEMLQAFHEGKIHLAEMPKFKETIQQETQKQLNQAINATELEKKQQAALKDEQAWYHQQIDQILQDKREQLDIATFQQSIFSDLNKARNAVLDQQQELNYQREQIAAAEKKQFWQHAMVTLLAIANTLLLVCFNLFVLKNVLYDGLWHGLGFSWLYKTVWALHTDHYVGSIILGIVGFIVLALALAFSSWCALQMTHYLTDFKLSRLKFWQHR